MQMYRIHRFGVQKKSEDGDKLTAPVKKLLIYRKPNPTVELLKD